MKAPPKPILAAITRRISIRARSGPNSSASKPCRAEKARNSTFYALRF